jgi:tellurite resistance protein
MNSIFNVFRISLAQVWLLSILVVSAFVLGAFARPGFDLAGELIGGFGKKEVYVAQKSDFERDVDAYFNSESHQARCMAMAKEQVSVDWAGKYLDIAKSEGAKVRSFEIKAVNQITEETATKTISIEKASGRR